MLQRLTRHEFQKLSELLVSSCGVLLNPDQGYLIESRLADFAKELNVSNFSDFYRRLVEEKDTLLPKMIDLMTTNETSWFRDTSCWKMFENHLIPNLFDMLKTGTPDIRIWSAACSTGQEAYSLAILIDEMSQRYNKPSYANRISILATDISLSSLELAKRGRYDGFNIKRGLSNQRRDAYFQRDGNGWLLSEMIKKRVRFEYFNLMDSFSRMGTFHVILCRNVAIYFAKDLRQELFKKIDKLLWHQGYLILGATESWRGQTNLFQSVDVGNAVYYEHASMI